MNDAEAVDSAWSTELRYLPFVYLMVREVRYNFKPAFTGTNFPTAAMTDWNERQK
jgi:tellurite resistance protein TehA-like permease